MKARSVLVVLALLFGGLAPTAIGSPSAPASSDGGGEVRMETGPGITLSGVLTLPHATGPFPAAVLLSDLGTGNQALTAGLTHAGVAVLQLDGRGSGKSTGTFLPWMPEITAADALAWVRWLGTRPGIDPQRIGLVGHSQGGVAAAMAAGGNPDTIAFVVLLAAVGVPVEEWQLHQMAVRGRALGWDAAMVAGYVGLHRDLYRHLASSKDDASAMKAARETMSEHLSRFTPQERLQLGLDNGAINEIVRQAGEPWFRKFVACDPRPAFRTVKCPVLALHGSSDLQVSAKENLESITAALKAGGNRAVTSLELAGLDHEFRNHPSGPIGEGGRDTQTIAPKVVAVISDWIRDQTRR